MNDRPQQTSAATLFGGLLLCAVGILFLMGNFFHILSIGRLWPLFMLVPVTLLAIAWIEKGRQASGVVIPMTILSFYAGYFLWLNYTSWGNTATTWPNFLIGPGLAFVLYYFVERKTGLLVPAFILLGLAALFYTALYDNSLIIGGFLILSGLYLLVRGLRTPPKKQE